MKNALLSALDDNHFKLRNLIVDIGNTRIKAAIFDQEKLNHEEQFSDLGQLNTAVDELDFDQALISTVKWDKVALEQQLSFDFVFLDHNTPLPISNGYGSPETLGLDRMAAVVGAAGLAKDQAVLAVDLGTCITYDFMDGRVYHGGSISPGMKMRFRAMHEQTAKLPLAGSPDNGKWPSLPADNTVTCLQSGVYYGIKFEIEGMVRHYQSRHTNLKVFICGGDANFFESLTKDHIFVIPNLVLHGLNRILIYNVDKK